MAEAPNAGVQAALDVAVRAADVAAVAVALSEGANATWCCATAPCPLHLAIALNYVDIVQ